MEKYNVKLSNGTVLDDLDINGTFFISKKELDESIFNDNLSQVIIEHDGIEEKYDRMGLAKIIRNELNGTWEFALYPISDQDLTNEYGVKFLANKLLNDEDAEKAKFLFDEWDPNGHNYKKDDRFQYNETLYKVLQDHTSQADWTPDTAVSLYVRIDDPSEEWPEWVQPLGAHDAYSKGYKVSHNGNHWTSDADDNVWEPGVYGWTEVPDQQQ